VGGESFSFRARLEDKKQGEKKGLWGEENHRKSNFPRVGKKKGGEGFPRRRKQKGEFEGEKKVHIFLNQGEKQP